MSQAGAEASQLHFPLQFGPDSFHATAHQSIAEEVTCNFETEADKSVLGTPQMAGLTVLNRPDPRPTMSQILEMEALEPGH